MGQPRTAVLAISVLLPCALALCACGGASTRAAMPDVAATDRSADDLGLAPLEEPGSDTGTGSDTGSDSDTGTGTGSDTGSDSGTGTDTDTAPAPASGTP